MGHDPMVAAKPSALCFSIVFFQETVSKLLADMLAAPAQIRQHESVQALILLLPNQPYTFGARLIRI